MNEQAMLFASLPESAAVTEPSATAEPAPRVLLAERNQIELRAMDLEATISLDHPARNVWAFVERLDLSALYGAIGSVEGRAGRAAIDPKILMALWLYATVDGVGSAREIERLTRGARRLSLDLRRGECEPSHAVGFPLRAGGFAR